MAKNKWITGRESVTRWGIKDFEIFDFLKKGLQPYTHHGKKVIDSDVLERAPRDSFDKILRNIRAKEHAQVLGSNIGPPKTEWEIKHIARRIYKSQRLEIVNPPKDCILMSFTLPNDETKAKQAIARAMGFLFKMEDVLKFEKEHPDLQPGQNREDINLIPKIESKYDNYEDFIRNLRVSYESDSAIKIQEPGKIPIICNCETLGFRNKEAKAWIALCAILQDPNQSYRVGSAYTHSSGGIKVRNQSYDHNQGMLRQISEKLIGFFNKNYQPQIPKSFNLFELCPSERAGTYKPKFQVVNTNIINGKIELRYNRLSKNQVLNKIEELSNKYYMLSDSEKDELTILTKIALEKKLATQDELQHILQPIIDRKEIEEEFQRFEPKYDPHEDERKDD